MLSEGIYKNIGMIWHLLLVFNVNSLFSLLSYQISLLSGWSVTDLDNTNIIVPTVDNQILKVESYNTYLLGENFYWSAPTDYLSNKVHLHMMLHILNIIYLWFCM